MPTAPLPDRYESFLKNHEYKKYANFCAPKLPGYADGSIVPVKFLRKSDEGLFDENDVDASARKKYVPFAELGDEPQFLVLGRTPAAPVYMWEHEDAKFYKVSPSLEQFLASLKTAEELEPPKLPSRSAVAGLLPDVEKAYRPTREETREKNSFYYYAFVCKVRTLIREKKYEQALKVVNETLAEFDAMKSPPQEMRIAQLYNLRGVLRALPQSGAYELKKAYSDFERSWDSSQYRNDEAYVHLAELSFQLKKYKQAAKLADAAITHNPRRKWSFEHAHPVYFYLGKVGIFAGLAQGDEPFAKAALQQLRDWEKKRIPALKKAFQEEYLAEGHPNAERARAFFSKYVR